MTIDETMTKARRSLYILGRLSFGSLRILFLLEG